MFGMPAPTAYDLNFRVLGIPVRVSPWFWFGMLLVSGRNDPKSAILFIACGFVSILVHELGHGLMSKWFGFRPEIALFAMGGLCSSDSTRQSFGQRLAILAAGPGAQFLLLGVLLTIGAVFFGISFAYDRYLMQLFLGLDPARPVGSLDPERLSRLGETGFNAFICLFQINWIWPLLNLLPIWPLDGGQISVTLLSQANRRNGARWAHIVSMAVAGLIAFYVLGKQKGSSDSSGFLLVFFFGGFAFLNFQMLQALHDRQAAYGGDDESDWWRR